jgi:hypothetical protein
MLRCAGSRKMDAEATLRLHRFIAPSVLLGMMLSGCQSSEDHASARQPRESSVLVTNEPVAFASHSFDPTAPPADMPPMAPGESAQCDSNFLSRASVRGQPRRIDATHATVTITQVKMNLKLQINIWLPAGATQVMADHEDGHRQISEYYYQTADKLAERIASTYIGRRVDVTGTDLDAECAKLLLQTANDITDEYDKRLNTNSVQLLYDDITDHARNGVIAKDAVDHALKNAAIEATQSSTSTGS